MANEREHPEEFDDGHMTWLMSSGYEAPPMREEFVQELFGRLDEAFDQAEQSLGEAATNGAPSPNGEVPELETSLGPGVESHDRGTGLSIRTERPSARSWRRVLVAMGTAATLLVALAVWSSGPSYGWASMLRALEDCSWLQAVSSDNGADASGGWLSIVHRVVAVKNDSHVRYDDANKGTRLLYQTGGQVVYQETEPASRAWNGEAELVRLLLGAADDIPLDLGDALVVEPEQESWRRVRREDGSGWLIELFVTLRIEGATIRRVPLVLLLDPETQLPVMGKVVDPETGRESSFDFNYPDTGPESIYSLGVAKETPVVEASLAAADARGFAGLEPQEPQAIVDQVIEPATTPVDASEESDKYSRNREKEASEETEEPWLPSPEPLSPEALSHRVDEQLGQLWQAQGIRPAEPASDAEFMRRVYLDLTGRIPAVNEAREFLDDESPDRREQLVDKLLKHRDHATHLAAVWREMLLPEGVDLSRLGGTEQFDEWLAERFGKNVPYDKLVRDLLLAEGRVSESGPLLFYAAVKLNPEELAGRTSRAFLGVRMDCAQCHDHPFSNVSQEDFWSFAAFFARISRPQGKMEMTSPVLRVRDTDHGEVMLPESDEVIPPRIPIVGSEIEDEPDSPSRRQQLVDWLTSPNNRHFAEATVNRVWAHMFGRGLVEPVDDMRPDNPPISPELLDTLSRDFAASGFDLRRLLRALVLTDAYQLSSQSEVDDPSRALYFAQMNIKSFTAEQLYDCISVATQRGAVPRAGADQAALVRFQDTNRQAFLDQFKAPAGQATDYQAGIPQALALMHGGLITGATDLATSGLLKSLSAPFFTNEQRVDSLFLATLSRYPVEEEREMMLDHVASAEDSASRQRAMGDILWALLNSAEFTFNH